MITQTIILTAGQTVKYYEVGNFVRVLDAPAPITVRTYKNGTVLTDAPNVKTGYAEMYDDIFEVVEFYSATAQTIQIVIRNGSQVYYDPAPTGAVSITNDFIDYSDPTLIRYRKDTTGGSTPITAAANINGALILSAHFYVCGMYDHMTGFAPQILLFSAPFLTNLSDYHHAYSDGLGTTITTLKITKKILIPAGSDVLFMSGASEYTALREITYKLL